MNPAPTILVVDDDEGHAILIRENLETAGLKNHIEHFRDGQAILDYLFGSARSPRGNGGPFLLLLDIRMPKVDGIEVLRRVKSDPELRKLPVIMLTTTDDSREVDRCHQLGCNVYIQKPVDYDKFADAIRRLGLFVMLLLLPQVKRQPMLP
ncbi:MAG TPA: response regulator [Candidatus Didemnitutus sp.]|nr:response regulator [Candidatus Didemnitutus sp.]